MHFQCILTQVSSHGAGVRVWGLKSEEEWSWLCSKNLIHSFDFKQLKCWSLGLDVLHDVRHGTWLTLDDSEMYLI